MHEMEGALPVAYGSDATSHSRRIPHLTIKTPPKRLSHVRFGSMAVVPQSRIQWKRHLASVKRDYSNCRYRECVIKCENLLQDTKDSDYVENAYTVFLHFYAATALEMQCRRVHHASKARLDNLTRARGHYQEAAILASAEEQSASHSSLYSLSPSTTLDSTFSQEQTSTRASSPNMQDTEHVQGEPEKESRQSMYEDVENASETGEQDEGEGDGNLTAITLEQELRDAEDEEIREDNEAEHEGEHEDSTEQVMSRPDSPTLGFDDWLGRSSPDILPPLFATLNDLKDGTEESEQDFEPTPVSPASETGPTTPVLTDSHHYEESSTDSEDGTFLTPSAGTEDSPRRSDLYAASRSLHRYRSALTSLRTQIASHIRHVSSEISSFRDPAAVRSLALSRSDEGMRKVELQARIERLKAGGWQRRGFDAERYEALRDSAVGDMLN